MSNARIIEIPATRQIRSGKNNTMRKMRVAAYCRVSTEEEEQQGSFETQKLYYTEKINSTSEWELAGIYVDDGISGIHTKKRDGFNQMIQDCKKKKIDLNLKAQLQKQLEKAQQEFDRLLEMSLELDESTPFLDDKLRKLSGKIKILKANIAESTDGKGEDEEATKQLTAQDLLIKEYDDILTARIIEKVIVHSRQEIEIYFIGGYTQKIDLI